MRNPIVVARSMRAMDQMHGYWSMTDRDDEGRAAVCAAMLLCIADRIEMLHKATVLDRCEPHWMIR